MENENLSSKKTKTKKGKIFDIVSWAVVLLIFAFSLSLVITRKADGRAEVFGHRYDVVLRNSMSYRNSEHAEFLKGTQQIQKMDVVRSKPVDKHSKLKVKDVVLFKDPRVGTNMHRIVDTRLLTQDEVYLKDATIKDKQIHLPLNGSAIYTNSILFKKIDLTIYSENIEFSDGYYFSIRSTLVEYSLKTTKVKADFYKHQVHIENPSPTVPGVFKIIHSKGFEYDSEYFSNITIYATNGKLNLDGSKFIQEDNIHHYFGNIFYEYEIRGDAAKTSDGWFAIDSIYSKVDKVIPKAGYITKYLTSIPGIIMLVGLGLIIVVADFAIDRIEKKKTKEIKNEDK